MAICNALTAGLDKSCDTNAGGVNKVFIADFVSFTPTISGGKITAITLPTNYQIANGTANWTTQNAGGFWVIDLLEVPNDMTGLLSPGEYVTATYYDQFTTNYTITFPIVGASYNAGTNTTTITPDWGAYGFQPAIGPSSIIITFQSAWTAGSFYEFKTNKNVCSYTETVQTDMANGTIFFAQVVNLVLSRRETTKREAIMKLIDGQKQLLIVVLDTNGIYWLFGEKEGVYVTSIEGGTGTAKSDMNGYTITFTGNEVEQAYEIDYSAIQSYLV